MWLRLFVTGKLGAITVYPTYDIYSESGWFRECMWTIATYNSPNSNTVKISYLGRDVRSFLKLHPKPKTVSELKVALQTDMGQLIFRSSYQNYPKFYRGSESTWWLVEDIPSIYRISKCVHMYGVCAVLNAIFETVLMRLISDKGWLN